MNEGAPRGAEAGDWLRQHFADTKHPHIDITWQPDSDPAAYSRLLEILFLPEPGREAA